MLFSANIINSIKRKNISGSEIFAQVIPKNSSIKVPLAITGSASFGVEDGEMVKIIDREFGRDAAIDSLNKAFMVGTKYLTRK
ncbi:hypothetical protein J4229_03120, partial [Candidatus Pacearchaeota archaeon]|nr:hypothetical protein [Candidatus Pacearchaeota archaeon]